MKALVCTKPGVLENLQIDAPIHLPGNTILKIKRIGVCGTDLHAFEGSQPFFDYPRILGHELAAEIAETDAPGFEIGQAVTIIPYFNCGHCIACRNDKPNCCVELRVCGVHRDGGMVEYLSVPSYSLIHNQGLELDELALVEPLAIGAHGIRRAALREGEFVLVVGAGPIGLGIMEFARIAGGKVIAVDINEERLEFCRSRLGVEWLINAGSQDINAELLEITQGDMPTVVIDATGSLKAIKSAFRFMAHGGRYVLVGLQKEEIGFSHPEFHKREATLMSSRNATRSDFQWVMRALQEKWIDPKIFITHRVAFPQVKDEFHKWLNPGHGVIKAMIEMN